MAHLPQLFPYYDRMTLPPARITAGLFLAWCLPLLLCTALIVPPWANSDEPFHMLRAVQVAHGIMLGDRVVVPRADGSMVAVAGGQSDPAIYAAFAPVQRVAFLPWVRLTAADLRASDAVKWQRGTQFAYFANTAQYPPVFYIGDALAYWIGRVSGMRINATLTMARLCNAAFFAGLSAVAIASAQRTRPLIMAVLMLPMSISLGASASQDSLLIPACALMVAWVDRLIAAGRMPGCRERVAMAVAFAAIGMARPPYALLSLLLVQADRSRAGVTAAGGACVAILLWCALVAVRVMAPMGQSDPVAQWRFVTAHPGAVLTIMVNTLAQTGLYASEFVGRLAWVDVPLPAAYFWLAVTAMVLCLAGTMVGRVSRPAIGFVAIGFAICAMLVLQYFDWTPVGRLGVEGIVGRYFLPLAFALGLALPTSSVFARPRRLAAYAGIVGLAAFTPGVMVWHFASRFYIA